MLELPNNGTFAEQARKLAENAALRAKIERRECAAVDRFHAKLKPGAPAKYNHAKAQTLHDLAQQNPLIHALLVKIQREL